MAPGALALRHALVGPPVRRSRLERARRRRRGVGPARAGARPLADAQLPAPPRPSPASVGAVDRAAEAGRRRPAVLADLRQPLAPRRAAGPTHGSAGADVAICTSATSTLRSATSTLRSAMSALRDGIVAPSTKRLG